ncbi:E3 Ubiquitin ligase [Candidatus Bilamarchaeum dharawalense]|uniref:E3 Ubiquitin ligase n=1 Tax=Candidatus Bilamarchaeum dharawalense TaxID=2885759 RepID=A0A5E4LTF8_9ARCH|nr:E3 Ubiquitin ligase [Candidatus Bilamarchaeum dharawalense]
MADCGVCIAGPMFFLAGLGMIYGGVQRYLLEQKIKNIPTSKVRSVAVGLVEIFGKAKCLDSLNSPISKVKCIYWSLKCEYYKSGKHGGWRDFYTPSTNKQFYLEDDTGKMLIDPNGAEIDIPSDLTSTGYLDDKGFLGMKRKTLDPKILDYLNNAPDVLAKFKSHSHTELRVTESFIAEGDPLYILGSAEPKEGASSAVQQENLIIRKGKTDQIMYVSDSNEKKAVEKIWWSIWPMIVGGFIFAAIGLYLLLDLAGV